MHLGITALYVSQTLTRFDLTRIAIDRGQVQYPADAPLSAPPKVNT